MEETVGCSPLTDDERQRCEIWTRVMGYHRPTESFNIGKKAEHKERKFFEENQDGRSHCTSATVE